MSIFNLNTQNENLDNKIIAGIERISQVFKTLLWEKAKQFHLSPIQIQVLIFIANHSQEKSTVSYLAQEFHITKPTVSDTVKTLEQKGFINKVPDTKDTRSYTIQLTAKGEQAVLDTDNFVNPLTHIIEKSTAIDKLALWHSITTIIVELNKLDIINVQRMCLACNHYSKKDNTPFCGLLHQNLEIQDIRIDCPEFESK
ncbi:MarR family winged helix-turn-helix transcriptional regulator [Flavobacterium litorale]|uniref:MarR family winged helix-turn-helix transcriptional regulator n=1 Tax=Flavobacterium litorale TaxID=2856519 RepID=A0ABX8V3A9_9FLAO|nr:MarR family winged helix-turn-helix transcriptional regulator [Flavobacterium litorale]QYJ67324.1 MarR family winged helix-turn-helix transcriptional regulator [Flavobacterium litorale]